MAKLNQISLEAIRYFEVSGRHLSFTKAGRELNISQSAVSQKIIQLEEQLGVKLFLRNPRQLSLTEEGKRLFQTTHQIMNQLNATLLTLNETPVAGSITILVSPAIGSKWLIPKLPAFFQLYQDIKIRVDVDLRLVDADPGFTQITPQDWDLAISPCEIEDTDCRQIHLFDDYFYPVASPELIHTEKLRSPADLKHCPILLDAEPKVASGVDWESWFEDSGLESIDLSRGHSFNQLDLMIKAAILGQGVAMGRHSLVADDVAAGRLVKLFSETPASAAYLVLREYPASTPQISVFIDWILSVSRNG